MDFPHNPEYPYYLTEADLVELSEKCTKQDVPDWELFLSYADRRDLEPGEVLIQQFNVDRSIFVLMEGALEVSVAVDPDGPGDAVAVVEPIAIIGEQSFLDGGVRTATITATTTATVYCLTRPAFDYLRREHSDIACAFLFDIARALSTRTRAAVTRRF